MTSRRSKASSVTGRDRRRTATAGPRSPGRRPAGTPPRTRRARPGRWDLAPADEAAAPPRRRPARRAPGHGTSPGGIGAGRQKRTPGGERLDVRRRSSVAAATDPAAGPPRRHHSTRRPPRTPRDGPATPARSARAAGPGHARARRHPRRSPPRTRHARSARRRGVGPLALRRRAGVDTTAGLRRWRGRPPPRGVGSDRPPVARGVRRCRRPRRGPRGPGPSPRPPA